MKIVLVRHGETEWSASGRHTSHTDLPLTDAGRQRAAGLRDALAGREFERVLCSPLLRARETCELAGFGKVARLCDDLREWDYGEYEGLTSSQIWAVRPDWSLWRDGCPGGEAPAEVGERADRALRALGSGSGAQAGGDALAFAHGHILRVLSARWLAQPPGFGARLALDAGATSALGYEHQTAVLRRWNA